MVTSNISIENARIGFRNFSGKEGKFNPPGKRNFCVFLDYGLGEALVDDGWNVRWLKAREEGDLDQPYLQVAVNFGNVPPKIVLITGQGKTTLDEESISILDWAEIKTVDLIIRPYNWALNEGTKNEKRGVKAYIKAMYVTIVEDAFAKKYYDVADTDYVSGENDGD